MLKFLIIFYLIGSLVTLYFYILGDKCAYYKLYRTHKRYNQLDYFMICIVLLAWPWVLKDFFKDKASFHFTWKVIFYTQKKAKKYL